MSTIATSGLYERTFSSRSSAVPLCPTILNPLPSSRLAMPSRSSTESSARTTRIGTPACSGSGCSTSTPGSVADPERMRQTAGACSAARREQRLDRPSRKLGLRDEAKRRAAGDQRPEIGAIKARGQDHLGRLFEGAQPLSELEPIEVGQLYVDDRQVRPVFLHYPQPFDAVSGFCHDGEAAPLEQLSRRCAEGAVVVDDEHAPAHGRIVPSVATQGSVASPTL